MNYLLRFQPMARVRMKKMRRRESGARKKCVLVKIDNDQHEMLLLVLGFFGATPIKDVQTAVAKEGDVDVVAQSHL